MLTINDFEFFVVFIYEHCLCVRCYVTFNRKFFVFDIDTKNYVILCFNLNFNIFFEIFCFNFRNDCFFCAYCANVSFDMFDKMFVIFDQKFSLMKNIRICRNQCFQLFRMKIVIDLRFANSSSIMTNKC